MAFRKRDAALVAEHGRELTWRVVDVSQFLFDPPGVLAASAVIVVATADPIEPSGIDDVAPLIDERSVETAVHRNFAVTVKLPTEDAQFVLAGLHTITAETGDDVVFRLIGCCRAAHRDGAALLDRKGSGTL